MDRIIWFVIGFVSFPFAYFGVRQGWQVVKQCSYWTKDKAMWLWGKVTNR